MAAGGCGRPYVVYQDVANGFKASVMRFNNGTSWEQARWAGAGAYYTSLALDGSGRPYVAYQDAAKANKASVMRFIFGFH
ncbi:MAG: hypothetical protein ACTFAL_15305 [Candidatus Electronema sp. V4]|uniref:hypothetical protein n=1 Tax=Candidatus Electronema sp. V4 TaxID=3454756 RepID=UPI00405596CA